MSLLKVALAAAGIAAAGAAWYLGSPLILDDVVDEGPVAATAERVATAAFTRIDNLHWADGTAAIYRRPDGSHFLRFEDGFEAANGPDLRVLVSAAADPRESEELGEYTEIADLKGNIGAQNYDLPADLDLAEIGSVVIYCKPFSVVFSTAPFATQ